jgi:ABC-type antimicrobial peptide transport system permease subunit
VLSTVVRQRTAEIGVRMALGAAPSRIFNLVVGQGLRLSTVGIVIGLAAAFELTRALSTMLVGVKPTDPATFVAMAALFLLIAAVASWLPARRAAALDPTHALRPRTRYGKSSGSALRSSHHVRATGKVVFSVCLSRRHLVLITRFTCVRS